MLYGCGKLGCRKSTQILNGSSLVKQRMEKKRMKQIPLEESALAITGPVDEKRGTHEITPDLAYKRLGIVNLVYFGTPHAGEGKWVLLDAGLPGTAATI